MLKITKLITQKTNNTLYIFKQLIVVLCLINKRKENERKICDLTKSTGSENYDIGWHLRRHNSHIKYG